MEDYLLFHPLINAVIREIVNIHNKLFRGHLVPPFLKTGNKKRCYVDTECISATYSLEPADPQDILYMLYAHKKRRRLAASPKKDYITLRAPM